MAAPDAKFEDVPPPTEDDDPAIEYEGDLRQALRRDVPPMPLRAHDGGTVDLSALPNLAVVFTFPLLSRPGVAMPAGWERVPDANGSTDLALSFRDAFAPYEAAGIRDVFGLSSQSLPELAEAADRLTLPYPLLSDPRMQLAFAVGLPRVYVAHHAYLAPTVLVLQRGVIAAGLLPGKDPGTAATRLLTRLQDISRDRRRAETSASEDTP